MVHKNCAVCGGVFRALGRSITCSPECSKQNARDYNARWRQERSEGNHSRKVDRELATTLRAVDLLDFIEERNREYARYWREANRERINEYNRQWRKANRDKDRESVRRYRARNPDKVKQWSREYEAANRERRNEMQRRRRRWAGSRLFG